MHLLRQHSQPEGDIVSVSAGPGQAGDRGQDVLHHFDLLHGHPPPRLLPLLPLRHDHQY